MKRIYQRDCFTHVSNEFEYRYERLLDELECCNQYNQCHSGEDFVFLNNGNIVDDNNYLDTGMIAALPLEIRYHILAFLPPHLLTWCNSKWFWYNCYRNVMPTARREQRFMWSNRYIEDISCERDYFFVQNGVTVYESSVPEPVYSLLIPGLYRINVEACSTSARIVFSGFSRSDNITSYYSDDKQIEYSGKVNGRNGYIYYVFDQLLWERRFEQFRQTVPARITGSFSPFSPTYEPSDGDDLRVIYARNIYRFFNILYTQNSMEECAFIEIKLHTSVRNWKLVINVCEIGIVLNIFIL